MLQTHISLRPCRGNDPQLPGAPIGTAQNINALKPRGHYTACPFHFQKDGGRVSVEKEHYALIFYDYDAKDNYDLIDLGVYVNPSSESTKGILVAVKLLANNLPNEPVEVAEPLMFPPNSKVPFNP